jgi:hypothetical protein
MERERRVCFGEETVKKKEGEVCIKRIKIMNILKI